MWQPAKNGLRWLRRRHCSDIPGKLCGGHSHCLPRIRGCGCAQGSGQGCGLHGFVQVVQGQGLNQMHWTCLVTHWFACALLHSSTRQTSWQALLACRRKDWNSEDCTVGRRVFKACPCARCHCLPYFQMQPTTLGQQQDKPDQALWLIIEFNIMPTAYQGKPVAMAHMPSNNPTYSQEGCANNPNACWQRRPRVKDMFACSCMIHSQECSGWVDPPEPELRTL